MSILLFIFLTLLICRHINIILLPRLFNQIVIFQLTGWVLFYFLHRDSTYFTRILYIILSYESLLLLYNCEIGCLGFAKSFNKVMLIMAGLGCVAFFSIMGFDISPILEYQNVDSRAGFFYGFTCTNARFGNIIRFSGFFDEPGAMAFWGMYSIIINALYIKNEVVERYLPLFLVFTLSLAFYIQYFMYIILFKMKSVSQTVKIFVFIFIIGLGIYQTKDTEFDKIFDMTFSRFEYDADLGSIKGDNRSELSETAKKIFIASPLIGQGPQIITKISGMADNPYENLATDGIIGYIIMYFPLIIIWLNCKNKYLLYGIIILMIGYLQRPFHPNFMHCFVLYLFSLLSIEYYNPRKDVEVSHYINCNRNV